MMNTIKPDLKFTPEFPEYFPDQKVPTLDTKVWMESNRSPTSSYRFLFEFIQSQCPQSTVNLCPQPELGPPSCLPYPKRCTGGSYTRALTFPTSSESLFNLFTKKLLYTGYSRDLSRQIILSGIKRFLRAREKKGPRGIFRNMDQYYLESDSADESN